MSAASLELVLRRVDALVHSPRLRVLPLQLGQVGERRLVALVAIALGLFTLIPRSPIEVPERMVFLPGSGWVDAGDVAGLPAAAKDGDRLSLAVVGGAVPGARAGLPDAAAPAEPPEPAHAAALGRKVSLNGASAAELEGLPGVGPKLAERIIAARPFRSVRDLDRVRGVGAKSLARLSPLVEP
ncbi:hypothetical protein LBMAG42_30430 [Deltaproteobacteria bacterium]|nr:hypothetical protein LBMAG42_30430 [Deltaproteobacteria bacterium]